jgi:hypothetical protein
MQGPATPPSSSLAEALEEARALDFLASSNPLNRPQRLSDRKHRPSRVRALDAITAATVLAVLRELGLCHRVLRFLSVTRHHAPEIDRPGGHAGLAPLAREAQAACVT